MLVLEHAYYSVISPEGCAAILWKNRSYADRAAEALKLTSPDLIAAGFADEMVPEPLGGAHTDQKAMATTLKTAILKNLAELRGRTTDELLQKRYEKFRAMGRFTTTLPTIKGKHSKALKGTDTLVDETNEVESEG